MITPPALAAALLAGGAVLLVSARGHRPLGPSPEKVAAPGREDQALLRRLRAPLALLGFAAGWAFVGGVVGVLAGIAAAAAAWMVLGRAESPSARRRRERLARDLPTGVELLAACLRAGSALGPALLVVAEALPGPLAEEFRGLHHRLRLGAEPATVWRRLGRHPQLGPMGRALARAHDTGAPVSSAVERLGAELRAEALAEIEQRARGVDVRASMPLGLCFLPAFLLVAVVPLVAGIFRSMSLFG